MNFDNNAVCDICGKPRQTLGRRGRQEHPACSKKRQELTANKKRHKPPVTLRPDAVEYFSHFK
jgi:hypothetical protein